MNIYKLIMDNSYKTLCRIDRRIKKYKKPLYIPKNSPDWIITPRIKRRIQKKKDTTIDFLVNDKYNNKLNKKVYK